MFVFDLILVQLIESHSFMKNFIKYSINVKRNFIKMLTTQGNEEKKQITILQQQQQQIQQQSDNLNNLDDLVSIEGELF